jgi:hypothetical protein
MVMLFSKVLSQSGNVTLVTDSLPNTISNQPISYTFPNYNQDQKYTAIPLTGIYYSNNTCVTFSELINYNYTDYQANWNNKLNVFPENYCYGMLSYNITRKDFSNIINKNISKPI